jgi:hypothetical protein
MTARQSSHTEAKRATLLPSWISVSSTIFLNSPGSVIQDMLEANKPSDAHGGGDEVAISKRADGKILYVYLP